MAVQGLTRKQIRQSVATNLMGAEYINSSATLAGSTSTLIDETLRGGDNQYRNWWMLGTSGDNNGAETRAESFAASGHTVQFLPLFGTATAVGDTYEMFMPHYSPSFIHDAINRAIDSAIDRYYDQEVSPNDDTSKIVLHTTGRFARFPLPSEFDMVSRVEYRESVRSKTIHKCDVAFDESVDSDFTVTVDTEKYWRGGSSVKFVTVGTVSAGDLASDSITSIDLSDMTHVEFWIRAASATAEDQYRLVLSSTTNGSTETEALSIPALSAYTDTYVRLPLANPENDTAIISVALENQSNNEANTIWLDHIQAVDHDSAVWTKLANNSWSIDLESRDLVLRNTARQRAGYSMLKIKGGSNPSRMTADTDVADIPEEFVIARATALCLMANSPAEENDTQGRRGMSAFWESRAQQEMHKFPFLVDVIKVG